MGLIERAVGDVQAAEDAAMASVDVAGGDRQFDIDFAALAARGLYTPERAGEQQALELRAVKRRVLRRLGYLQRAARDASVVRQAGRARNIVMVTSTRPGEGKTYSAVNLALSLALEDRIPVLLIDGDTPRPKVRSCFGLPSGQGLTDRIADPSIPLGSLVWRARQGPLAILGEGERAAEEAGGLFASSAAARLFAGLSVRQAERVIIVDAPPMLATTETYALARHADEIIFVVEADATPEPAAASALDELLEINPNVGLLLNRCLVPAGGAHYRAYEQYERTPAETAPGPRRRG